ncbi:hypothetical protein AB4Z34_25525 [Ensifer sp. 2YAB10]|uniref:hypothetical protein n=1 Tax=unclassified Ensifer TaxID=2633371 RepID=UPI003F8FD6A3
MGSAKQANEPFFVWLNTSRMHLYTRLNDEWRYAAETYTSEADFHGSGMLQHDHDVGLVLKWLDDQGLARRDARIAFHFFTNDVEVHCVIRQRVPNSRGKVSFGCHFGAPQGCGLV